MAHDSTRVSPPLYGSLPFVFLELLVFSYNEIITLVKIISISATSYGYHFLVCVHVYVCDIFFHPFMEI